MIHPICPLLFPVSSVMLFCLLHTLTWGSAAFQGPSDGGSELLHLLLTRITDQHLRRLVPADLGTNTTYSSRTLSQQNQEDEWGKGRGCWAREDLPCVCPGRRQVVPGIHSLLIYCIWKVPVINFLFWKWWPPKKPDLIGIDVLFP